MRDRAELLRRAGPVAVLLLCLPLLAACTPLLFLAGHAAARALLLALGATLACLLLVAPPVLSRRPRLWLLPAFGLQLLTVIFAWRGAYDGLRAACAGLPIMALALAALWSTVPDGVFNAAASAGAPPAARLRLAASLFLPKAGAACLLVFLLCLALLIPQHPPR